MNNERVFVVNNEGAAKVDDFLPVLNRYKELSKDTFSKERKFIVDESGNTEQKNHIVNNLAQYLKTISKEHLKKLALLFPDDSFIKRELSSKND